ncbi:MAG: DNA-3-methyladenine glycosylase [Patescibacteria group bacterium]|nr:DNA-3-methyladenine glycosylase [Patescibacteria group bacterium]
MKHPYCVYVSTLADKNDVDKIYHDKHYGVPIRDDDELFGRLIMEINQAGLSWRTILMKEKGFRGAYHNFSITKVSKYKEKDIARLLNDANIIRNRLKIHAAVYNAQEISKLQKEFGSFRKWLDKNAKEAGTDKKKWVLLFKKHFKFVGGEIVGEFLMSINVLPGAHDKHCKRARI